MPVKMPPQEALGMNMTPMIDIVFNMVQFFMLTVDMSHKELAVLELPRANQGIEDKDPGAAKGVKKEDATRFVINLEIHKELGPCIYFRGIRWPISSKDPADQDKALESLRQELISLHRNPTMNLREPDGSSKLMILVRGDRAAKWKYVQWIMQVCADPALKIYKIHFAVEHPRKDNK